MIMKTASKISADMATISCYRCPSIYQLYFCFLYINLPYFSSLDASPFTAVHKACFTFRTHCNNPACWDQNNCNMLDLQVSFVAKLLTCVISRLHMWLGFFALAKQNGTNF